MGDTNVLSRIIMENKDAICYYVRLPTFNISDNVRIIMGAINKQQLNWFAPIFRNHLGLAADCFNKSRYAIFLYVGQKFLVG